MAGQIRESDTIHHGTDYFDETSEVPFVIPASKVPPHMRPATAAVQPGFSADDDGIQYDDISSTQREVGFGQPMHNAPLRWTGDESDTSTIGQVFNIAVKLKQLDKTNIVEKIRITNTLKGLVDTLVKEVEEDKATLLKELGIT